MAFLSYAVIAVGVALVCLSGVVLWISRRARADGLAIRAELQGVRAAIEGAGLAFLAPSDVGSTAPVLLPHRAPEPASERAPIAESLEGDDSELDLNREAFLAMSARDVECPPRGVIHCVREELSLLALMAKNTGEKSDVADDLNPVELGETLENYAERLTIAVELLDRQCMQAKRSKNSN